LNNSILSATDFSVFADNIPHKVSSVSKISDQKIEIAIADSIVTLQVIKLDYTGNSIKDSSNKLLETFKAYPVDNNRPAAIKITSAKSVLIQAENFYKQKGLELEECKDTDAGKNLAYTSIGDYADYNIIVNESGNFKVDFRIAAQSAGGIIELQLLDNDKKTVLGTINVPATGGWQVYNTVGNTVFIPKGQYTFRVYIKTPEFNINWFQFNTSSSVSNLQNENEFIIFPNPAKEHIRISSQKVSAGILSIYSIEGQLLLKENMYPDKEINILSLKNGFYFVKLNFNKEDYIQTLIVKR
jgi:hypothetical protein